MSQGPEISPVTIDVSRLLDRSIASLYSYLVTRPTGRAVRLAIEGRLPGPGRISLSVIDLSQVLVLDFSCADEVVAQLLLRYLRGDRPREAFFLFRGLGESHLDPIQAVLERHRLAAVAEGDEGHAHLLGVHTHDELELWLRLEERGRIPGEEVLDWLGDGEARSSLELLVRRRLLVRSPSGDLLALSSLAPPGGTP